MANNQAENDAVTEASHESEQDIVQALTDLTPPADLRLQRSYGFYDYSTSSTTSSTSNPIPTTNTDIAAAHRGLQEADACRSKTNQNTDDNDCSSGSGIALKTRVAEFMERMDTWNARRNFGIAPTPVGAIPKRPKLGDPHVQSLTSVGSSPFQLFTEKRYVIFSKD